MKSIKEELPEDPDQSAIINKDTEFENPSVDPGFAFEETQENSTRKLSEVPPGGESSTALIPDPTIPPWMILLKTDFFPLDEESQLVS